MARLDPAQTRFVLVLALERVGKLRVRLDKLAKDDRPAPEHIHKCRVASRKLRAALGLLGACVPKKKVKAWSAAVKAVTRELGDARDADAQLALVEEALRDARAAERPGLKHLRKTLRGERARHAGRVTKAASRLVKRRTLDHMEDWLQKHVDRLGGAGASQGATLPPRIAKDIEGYLDGLLALRRWVHRPEAIERLYEMRIAAKRLRYALEMLEPVLGPRVRPAIATAEKVQALLGQVHDADVWQATLDQTECDLDGKDDGSTQALRPGLEHLRQGRRRYRERRYRALVRAWEEATRRRVWARLRTMLRYKTGTREGKRGGVR